MFVDKVVWKLSIMYSVDVLDLSLFMVVVKVIFGFFGGGVYCRGVFVELLEGFFLLKIKEICI